MTREKFVETAADFKLTLYVRSGRLAWSILPSAPDDLLLALHANEALLVAGLLRRVAYAAEVAAWNDTAPFSDDAARRAVVLKVARDSGSFAILSPFSSPAPTPGGRFFLSKSEEVAPTAQGDAMRLTNDFGG